MNNDSFKLSFKVSGTERKGIASGIAAALMTEADYAGAPSFSYKAGGWVVDREGRVSSPETPMEEKESIRPVLDALKTSGATASESATVTFSLDGHTGNTLRNIINLVWSKQALIQKSFGRPSAILPESLVTTVNAEPIDSLDDFAKVINDGIDSGEIQGESEFDFDLADKILSFSFANATLETDEALAFITLCRQINEQAKQQKYSSTRQKETDNDKFSFRVWLIRLGFVGSAFATDRKVLLARLTGDAAFRTETARQAAEAKRKVKQVRADA